MSPFLSYASRKLTPAQMRDMASALVLLANATESQTAIEKIARLKAKRETAIIQAKRDFLASL